MNTIVVNAWQVNDTMASLLNTKKYITDHQVLAFSSWVASLSQIELGDFPLFDAYNQVARIRSTLTVCSELSQQPAFIEQVYRFYESLIEYDIDLNTLPTTTPLYRDLKQCLMSCQSIYTPYHQRLELQNTLTSLSHVQIDEQCFSSISLQSLSHTLQDRGAVILRHEVSRASQISFYHALNLRQEIEACAQYILKHDLIAEDINIVLCDYSQALPFLQVIFDYYQIPYYLSKESTHSLVCQAFIDLTSFLRHPHQETLKPLLTSGLLKSIDVNATLEYIDYYVENLDITLASTHISDIVMETPLAQYEKERLLQLEQQYNHTIELLNELLQTSLSEFVLERAYEICRQSTLVEDPQEFNIMKQIQARLNATKTPDLNDEQINCVLYAIQQLQINKKETINQGICIGDLNRPLAKRKVAFILNGNSKHFPGNCTLSGVFEEEYVKQIPTFPSKLARSNFHFTSRQWITACADHLILSYATNTYEGKGLECSHDIKTIANQPSVAWPLLQNNQLNHPTHKITSDLAQQLYFKEDGLHGSISSFERFFRCPYSYFLYTGLKLRKTNQIRFNQALVGSIQHAVIEKSIEKYGHQYAQIEITELRTLVKEQFEAAVHLFTSERYLSEIVVERCITSLSKQFEFLRHFEEQSSLTHHESEMEFNITLLEDSPIPIHIKGFIDRIDSNHNHFRIIDFKSSSKSIRLSKVEAGLQLQLFTYLIAAQKVLKKDPFGAYYYSLKHSDVNLSAAKLSLRTFELEFFDEDENYAAWIKNHRFSGKTTDANQENDLSGKHIVGWNAKGPTSSQLIDMQEVTKISEDLYFVLSQRLFQGVIDCTPTEDACTFCDYKMICRYFGQKYKKNITSEEISEERERNA